MKAIQLDAALYDYFLSVGVREQPILQLIREFAESHPRFRMLSTPDAGQLLQMLVRLTQAKQVLEIGTFLGYSAAAMAIALPQGGKVTTCEVDAKYADIAQVFWQQGNLVDKIECFIGPALETLVTLPESFYDLVFIDADKAQYESYYEMALKLVRQGGLIVLDNMLLFGQVIDTTDQSQRTKMIRQLNQCLKNDDRVDLLMLTVGDGMTLALKR